VKRLTSRGQGQALTTWSLGERSPREGEVGRRQAVAQEEVVARDVRAARLTGPVLRFEAVREQVVRADAVHPARAVREVRHEAGGDRAVDERVDAAAARRAHAAARGRVVADGVVREHVVGGLQERDVRAPGMARVPALTGIIVEVVDLHDVTWG
jgi:hypothetical protein